MANNQLLRSKQRTPVQVPENTLFVATDGLYVLQKEIGNGGMARVFRAMKVDGNCDLGKVFAVKLPLSSASEFVDPINREAAILEHLQSRGCVGFVSTGFTGTTSSSAVDSFPGFVMEILDGKDLAAAFEYLIPLSVPTSVFLLRAILESYALIHDAGVVHLDAKPENLFLDLRSDSKVKVIDFGISDFSSTTADVPLGTPQFISPERLTGGTYQLHPTLDLYSIGVIGCVLLTGTFPWGDLSGASQEDVLSFVLRNEVLPFSTLAPNSKFSSGLEDLLRIALETNPEDRFQSASAFRRALESFAGNAESDPLFF